jgi:hypothetical protein
MFHIEINLPQSGPTKFTYSQADGGIKSITEFRRAINLNKEIENQTVLVTFNNVKGYWHSLMVSEDRYLLQRNLKVFDEDILIGSFQISDIPKANIDEFKLKGDSFSQLKEPITKALEKDQYSSIPDENNGKYSNILFGTASDEGWKSKGMLTARRVTDNKFHAAWHHLKSITNVYKSDGTSVSFSQNNDIDGCCYIETSGINDLELYFNAQGAKDDLGDLIQNPAEMLEKLNDLFGNYTLDGIDEAKSIYGNRGYSNNVILIEDKEFTWKKFFQEFSREFDCDFFPTVEGKIKINVLDWNEIEPVLTLYPTSIVSYQPYFKTDKLRQELVRKYKYHYRDKEFRFSPHTKVDTLWNAKVESELFRLHSEDLSCLDVGARMLFLDKQPKQLIDFSINKDHASLLELADIIKMRYPIGLYPDEYRLIKVLEITPLEGTNYAQCTGLDVNEINKGQIIFRDENDPQCSEFKNESDKSCQVFL